MQAQVTQPQQQTGAFLIGVDTGAFDAERSIAELGELCRAAGLEVKGEALQKRDSPDSATCVGTGKLEEVRVVCEANEIELLVFDCELSAKELRNIEKATELAVLDRTMLILDIFATRAISAEGKLQVELAQQKYRLPRLAGMGTALSRIGSAAAGTGVGTRGPGETKLETDKRYIRRRIASLERKLSRLEESRALTRRRRIKNEVPAVSIVGYTNAGKSTLLNTLTGAGVLSRDMLFATLDPTARSLDLPSGRAVVLIDTVGFISRLPHHLVEAFHSTLEEAVLADVVLLMCDYADSECDAQLAVSRALLQQLGCAEDKIITVYNKCDLASQQPGDGPDTAYIAALTGDGVDHLLKKVDQKLGDGFVRLRLHIPYEHTGVIARLRETGKVFSEEYQERFTAVDALVDKKILFQVKPFIAEPENLPADCKNGE